MAETGRIQKQVRRALGISRGGFTPIEQHRQVLHAVELTRDGRLLVPCQSRSRVAAYTPPIDVQGSQLIHACSRSGRGSLLIPLARFDIVLLHAQAVAVKGAEIIHARAISGGGGLLVPSPRLSVILGGTATKVSV